MASITHKKVSAIPDGADTNLVLPSDWNNEHSLSIPSADAALITAGFLTSASAATAYQPAGDYVGSASLATTLATYITSSSLATALSPYLTSASASAAYVTSASLATTLGTYLTSASASALYLTSASAALSTYLTSASASALYVTSASLATTLGGYITSSSLATALGPYLTSASAALGTYVTSSSLATALGPYLTSASANLSTYLSSVSISQTLSEGQFLVYRAVDGKWHNETVAPGSGEGSASISVMITSAMGSVKLFSGNITDVLAITASFAGTGYTSIEVCASYGVSTHVTPNPVLQLSTDGGSSVFLVGQCRPTGTISATTKVMTTMRADMVSGVAVYIGGAGFACNGATTTAGSPRLDVTSTVTTGTVVNQIVFCHRNGATTMTMSAGVITVYGYK
jgi:hypothetical protein